MKDENLRREKGSGSIQKISENEYYARIRYFSPYRDSNHGPYLPGAWRRLIMGAALQVCFLIV